MSKPNNQPVAEDILRLAGSLVDDNATNDDELRRQLREGGIDPDALRARFHHSATQVAKREQAARRPVPLALQQAIEATRPADGPEDEFEDQSESQSVTAIRIADRLDRLLSPLGFSSNLETARAYRKSSQLAKSDQPELDQLESELKERVKKTNPDLDLVALMSESFLRRFGPDSRDRLTEIAEEFGIDVLYRPTESYDGALLRIRDTQRGYIVINSRIREESRNASRWPTKFDTSFYQASRKSPPPASSKGLKTGARISIAPNSKPTVSPPRF